LPEREFMHRTLIIFSTCFLLGGHSEVKL
jgi:hypothetical protein